MMRAIGAFALACSLAFGTSAASSTAAVRHEPVHHKHHPQKKNPIPPVVLPPVSPPTNVPGPVPVTVPLPVNGLCVGTGHVILTHPNPDPASGGVYSFSNCLFPQGLEVGAFKSTTSVTVKLDHVEVTNTSGTPGAPNARGISVLPGGTVFGQHVTVHHTLGDGLGVLGGTMSMSFLQDYDNYGGAPLNKDHEDGIQVTSGNLFLANSLMGVTPTGGPSRTGNLQLQSDAGPVQATLLNDTIAGYGGRWAVYYRALHGLVTGSYSGLTIDSSAGPGFPGGSIGGHISVQGAAVAAGPVTVK